VLPTSEFAQSRIPPAFASIESRQVFSLGAFVFFGKLSRFCYGGQNRRRRGWFGAGWVVFVMREIEQIRKMRRIIVSKNQIAVLILELVPISQMFYLGLENDRFIQL
jgi:hypothetical protein